MFITTADADVFTGKLEIFHFLVGNRAWQKERAAIKINGQTDDCHYLPGC